MARDDEAPDEEEFGFANRDQDLHDDRLSDDFGDELDDRRIDADEDHAATIPGASAPDPGYAAYADEPEDPLADWPFPDRGDGEPGEPETGDRSHGEPRAQPGPHGAPDESLGEDLGAGAGDWPFAEPRDALGAEDSSDNPARVPPGNPPTDPDDEVIDDFLRDLDDPAPGSSGGLEETGSYAAPESPAGPAPDPSPGAQEPGDFSGAATPLDEVVAATTGGAALLSGGTAERGHDADPFSDGGQQGAREARQPGDDGSAGSSQLIPWAMVLVVVLAVVLLAVGGYGVIKERGALEARIRELQAQLATAVSTQEIAAEREAQRQIESENRALEVRLAALEAENAAMIETISALEARVGTDRDELGTDVGEAAATTTSAQPPATAASSDDGGSAGVPVSETGDRRWFVNFGSYASRADADRWAQRLRVKEGDIVVQSTESDGKTLHRVRVIGLTSGDSAERVATALEREYDLPRLWVGRN